MKKLFLAGLLALSAVLSFTGTSKADGWFTSWTAGRSAGFGGAADKALSCFSGIHQHGPLYNYTPMMGEYTWMQFNWLSLYHYTPATPIYYPRPTCGSGGCGNSGHGTGACNGGAFSGLFGCGLNNSSCGGSSWFGWFQKGGCGGSWPNIFSKGCGTPACGSTGTSCSGCTSSTTPITSGVIQTGHISTLYPEYLSPAWR